MTALQTLGLPARAKGSLLLLIALVLLFAGIGAVHILDPERLLPIVPDWVPYPRIVVIATGVCELLACVGFVIPQTRRITGVCLALYAVCVFPANVKQAFEHIPVRGLPDSWWYHGPRLAFQPVLVWAPLFASGLIRWPFERRIEARAED